MKTLLANLITAATMAAASPTPAELQTALANARSAWGAQANIRSIALVDLGPCNTSTARGAWSDFRTRDISINANCHWSPAILQVAVAHEYGHMLTSTEAHSFDKHSVMFWQFAVGQRVTKENRRKAAR